ncbi:MAG: hypothetical protein ACK5MN_03355 [Lachnospiraceae bacterium]
MTEEKKETAKDYLMRYYNATSQLIRIDNRIAELRCNKMNPSLDLSGMPKGSEAKDMSDYAATKDKLEREFAIKRIERLNIMQEVEECIESLDDEREKSVLTERYLEFKYNPLKQQTWEEICCKLGYSWKHIHRIHGTGLAKIQNDIE